MKVAMLAIGLAVGTWLGWEIRGDRIVVVGSCELETKAAVLEYRLQSMERSRAAMLGDLRTVSARQVR